MQGRIGKDQLGIVQMQQLLVLAHNAVLRLKQHANQRLLVQRIQHGHDRQTADQLRDQAEFYQIVRLDLFQQLLAGLILVERGTQLAAKAQRGIVGALLDELFQPVKGTTADKEDIFGVDLDELLLRMLAAAVGRHIADRTLHDLQQGLLHTLTAHIAGDGGVLALAGDLVDLIHIDDADFSARNVKIRRLNQLEQDVFDILAHIAGLGQRGGVRNGERHIQHLGQRLGQQRLAGAGGAQHQHIGLLQLHIAVLAGQDALIVVVDRDSQHLLGGILPDDILIQTRLDFGRGQDMDALERIGTVICAGLLGLTAAVTGRHTGARRGRTLTIAFQHIAAHFNAVLADIDAGTDDQLLYLVLGASAKAADKLASFSVLTGRLICHVVPPNQCL